MNFSNPYFESNWFSQIENIWYRFFHRFTLNKIVKILYEFDNLKCPCHNPSPPPRWTPESFESISQSQLLHMIHSNISSNKIASNSARCTLSKIILPSNRRSFVRHVRDSEIVHVDGDEEGDLFAKKWRNSKLEVLQDLLDQRRLGVQMEYVWQVRTRRVCRFLPECRIGRASPEKSQKNILKSNFSKCYLVTIALIFARQRNIGLPTLPFVYPTDAYVLDLLSNHVLAESAE